MRIGVAVGGPLDGLGACARAAEQAGFASVWCAETSHDAFVQATALVTATERVHVGTGVALAFPRSPTTTAMAAWDLDELSNGRFVLGLGSQVRGVLERRFSVPYEAPAAKMTEYVEVLRTVWRASRGEKVTHAGRFYNVRQPSFYGDTSPERRLVPVMVAAVGPRMLQVAGAVADGVLGHGFSTRAYLAEVVAPTVRTAAEDAGRDPDEVVIGAGVITAVAEDPAVARREAALQVAFYATTPSYERVLALHGWEGLRADCWAAFSRRDLDGMVAAVPDEVLDAFAVAGAPEDVRGRLAAYEAVADELVLHAPWFAVTPGRAAENNAALLDVFSPVAASR